MKIWFVCDENHETQCIYTNEAVDKLKTDPIRCIRHGALLFSSKAHDGMSRAEIEKVIHG